MEYLLNNPWLLGIVILLVSAAVIEAGRWIAIRSRVHEDTHHKDQMVAIRDGLFVLVGLLLGFTLALVVPRYNERRMLVIEEAVAIETAYLRADTLPQPYRDQAQQLLRQYVDARLDLDDAGLDAGRVAEASKHAKRIQDQLWEDLIEVTKNDRSAIAAAYVNSLTEVIDLHAKRIAAQENRIPLPIWLLILSVSLIAIFTRGLTLARRFWLTLVLAPITIAIVVALIADLDTPSAGLIRLDHRAMERLKAEINDHQ